jgi:GNAT superfamily N-acetyltransferase
MLSKNTIQIREAGLSEDALIAQHFYQMWQDNQVPATSIQPNWEEITIQFIEQARHNLFYKAFIAEIDQQVVGSTSCQLFAGLYPHILTDEVRKYGYIWGVYVEPAYRRQGIAKQLTQTAIDYLKDLGCTQTILHASPLGLPVYQSLGFVSSNEMRFNF